MNAGQLSLDTQAILLLCGRFGGEKHERFKPLSIKEYSSLAVWLQAKGLRPADVLLSEAGAMDVLDGLREAGLDGPRLSYLLNRGAGAALALDRWHRAGVWVLSRGDHAFPKRLKRKLKHAAPPLLYGMGNPALLDLGGLAMVGSRSADEDAISFTQYVAGICASAEVLVISGGARGVDEAAMSGALNAGGRGVAVLANDLLKTGLSSRYRLFVQEGMLALVSPYYPEAVFSAGSAMGRNRFIYTLSDAGLVVDSDAGKGGTWEGAMENLSNRWVPLHVRMPGSGAGNSALVAKGALAFHGEMDVAKLNILIHHRGDTQGDIFADAEPQSSLLENPPYTHAEPVRHEVRDHVSVGENDTDRKKEGDEIDMDMYGAFIERCVLLLASGTLSELEVAEKLGLEKMQARHWLDRAVKEEKLTKLKRPARYALF